MDMLFAARRRGAMPWSGRLPSLLLADMCTPGVCTPGARPEYAISAVSDGSGKGFRAVVEFPLLPHMTEEGPLKASSEMPARQVHVG